MCSKHNSGWECLGNGCLSAGYHVSLWSCFTPTAEMLPDSWILCSDFLIHTCRWDWEVFNCMSLLLRCCLWRLLDWLVEDKCGDLDVHCGCCWCNTDLIQLSSICDTCCLTWIWTCHHPILSLSPYFDDQSFKFGLCETFDGKFLWRKDLDVRHLDADETSWQVARLALWRGTVWRPLLVFEWVTLPGNFVLLMCLLRGRWLTADHHATIPTWFRT